MGRASNRKRLARIASGEEKPTQAMRSAATKVLMASSTETQVSALSSVTGKESSRMRKVIEQNAPREMDKAIRKFQKQGKEITVDSLLAEAKSTPGFLKMCSDVGIELSWFEELARKKMIEHGIEEY